MKDLPPTWDWELTRTALDAPQTRAMTSSACTRSWSDARLTSVLRPDDRPAPSRAEYIRESYRGVRGDSSLADLLSSGEEFDTRVLVERVAEVGAALSNLPTCAGAHRTDGDALNRTVSRFLARAALEGSVSAPELQSAVRMAPIIGPGDAVGLARIVLVGDPKYPKATDILMPGRASAYSGAHRARVGAELFLFASLFRTFDKPVADAVAVVADAYLRQLERDDAVRNTMLVYLIDHPRRLAEVRGHNAEQVEMELAVAMAWRDLL